MWVDRQVAARVNYSPEGSRWVSLVMALSLLVRARLGPREPDFSSAPRP